MRLGSNHGRAMLGLPDILHGLDDGTDPRQHLRVLRDVGMALYDISER